MPDFAFAKQIFKFCGSIKFAIPLLAAITGILIWATFYESQVGSSLVQQEVYKSPWFGALMFLLALNLAFSALTRYPWRGARKIGFALTHLGLVVIIMGSAAVIHLGVEGMILVRTDAGANNQIRIEGDVLEVLTPAQELQKTDVVIHADGHITPSEIANLSLENYSENTVKTVYFTEGATVENPAIQLVLNSETMNQKLERWLAIAPTAYSQVPVGPATLEILQPQTESELQQLLQPQQQVENPWGNLQIQTPNNSLSLDIANHLNQAQKLDENLTLTLKNFWPDFRLNRDNQPSSASEELNNPAVQLELTSSQGRERWFIFGKPEIPPVRTVIEGKAAENINIAYNFQTPEPEAYFRVIAAPDQQLYYAAKSSRNFSSGNLAPGDTIRPGWADFQITLAAYIPHGQVQRQVVPVPATQAPGTPALLVQTPNQQPTWLPWGEPTAIDTPNGEMFAAFTPKLLELPFAISLDDFIVERNEGSESVAMWTSKIRILDPEAETAVNRAVWMNHPTWYQGWKIAQASWNPGDLSQSTLQVKREPLWVTATTWTGSALVILGIATMFYGRALAKKLQQIPVSTASVNSTLETVGSRQ
ncbi:MAG: cytochrome c biogenesis protein ResB [Jaaginema sp. PMC 1079.18]|nr:cytochrome c biogenesis protein ResB [Jaaginema sp. PMC 1080.18]MEC4849440.1 cytochrome c biogenesis protein ResB [Jaaginema sp. PMC 1079.18]MEC4865461.1 cytochrome c biogenesis protein ResB [Jaaginema sp. PMC 1078.18]